MSVYSSIADVKLHLVDMSLDSSYDAVLTMLVLNASRAIDRYTKRSPNAYLVEDDEVRYFGGSGSHELWVDEMADEPTLVEVAETGQVDNSTGSGGDYTTYAASEYFLLPENADKKGIPYEVIELDRLYGTKTVWYRYPRSVKITAKFGYAITVPETIAEATIIQAGSWFKRGQQGFMQNSAQTRFGQLQYKQLDPDVLEIVKHYMRTTV